MVTRLEREIASVRWGGPPPPRARHAENRCLTVREIVRLADQRPGVWGNYDISDSRLAGVLAYRLRDTGLEACSRGTRVYFRSAP